MLQTNSFQRFSLSDPDPEKSSEIEVEFLDNGDSKTTVKFEHRDLKNHGEVGKIIRKR